MERMMNDSLNSISSLLKTMDSILIFPHINMDGDAMGSSTALCLALRKMGKRAFVMLNEPIPKNLDFLECGCSTYDENILDDVQLSLQIDSCGMNRIYGREVAWERGRIKGCIDHHASGINDIKYNFYRTEPKTAATGEIIYKIIKLLGVEISLEIANCIFAAITTDTGNFQHTNTTRNTHEIVAELYDVEGFDSKTISALIYDRQSKEAIKMESDVLANLEFYSEGKIATGEITQELLKKNGCSMNESEGIIQRIMSIDGVEVGCLFKEKDQKVIMVSLRSKHHTNTAAVAAKFGGGGHLRASGCTMNMNLQEAKEKIIPQLIIAVEK